MRQISSLVDAFKEYGFIYQKRSPKGLVFHGSLFPPHAKHGYPCEVIVDPDLAFPPLITLLNFKHDFPTIVPHIGVDGTLCYLAKDAIVLDCFDLVGQSLRCLQEAAIVLGKVLNGEMIEDFEEEFSAYWQGNLRCFLDIESPNNKPYQIVFLTHPNNSQAIVVSNRKEKTLLKLSTQGYKVEHDRAISLYRIKAKLKPRPLIAPWPPNTVSNILDWQKQLEPNCRKKIKKYILAGLKKKCNSLILIESPEISYGFVVNCSQKNILFQNRNKQLLGLLPSLNIMRLHTIKINDSYIAQRNIPNRKTLSNKKITLVGCGTIGGYLAEMLVKAGAGTLGGELTLVDYDFLEPQNIGRHRLGFPYIFINKAQALALELQSIAPSINIRALPVDAREAYLGSPDLLIDATGEEALGHWLCKKYNTKVSMLSVWIEGAGVAARALLKTTPSGACFRCLWHANRKNNLLTTTEKFPLLMAGNGCEGIYVPFSVSASLTAASLGAEMALDWVNNSVSCSLRTRLVDYNYQLATPDCTPLRDIECQACFP